MPETLGARTAAARFTATSKHRTGREEAELLVKQKCENTLLRQGVLVEEEYGVAYNTFISRKE